MNPSAAPQPAVPQVPFDPAARARVLVADDNDIARALAVALVEREGVDVDIAADGLAAVAKTTAAADRGEPYQLILMDVRMPNLDGVSATRRLRAAGFGPDLLPIVALTANGSPAEIAECLAAGMQAHIAKPVAPQQVHAIIASYIADRRAGSVPEVPTGRVPGDPLAAKYRTQRDAAMVLLDDLSARQWRRRADVVQLVDLLHRLAGTAGHFGQAELGHAASNLECELRRAPRPNVAQTLARYRDKLIRLAAQDPH